ncbi:MAG: OFA family MFS transporter [Methanosarcinales archaeon]|jgi:OFA family oxalate/formate antiporter-like MFS transporter|nr:OFA family MFS transporter [Methanosarcinales archaeon]
MENLQEVKVHPKKRYGILAAAMIMQLCAGIVYMWSVFQQPVTNHLNWDPQMVAMTVSIMLTMFVVGLVVGGYAQDKLGPRKIMLLGSILFGSGIVSTSFVTADAPWMLYITYGVIAGFGAGTIYSSSVALSQKWFLEKKGFAIGMVICAFGSSLVVFSYLVHWGLNNIGVQETFLYFGATLMVICFTSALFVQNPPKGYLPPGFKPSQKMLTKRQYHPKEVVKTKQYYLLMGGLLFALPAFFILSPMFISLGVERGLTVELAVFSVMLAGIFSASGRLFASWSADKISGKIVMTGLASLICISSLGMIIATGTWFLVGVAAIAFGFGGSISTSATMMAESFGTKFGGMNDGLLMIGYGTSALVFPIISNMLGNLTYTFIMVAATCIVTIILARIVKDPKKGDIESSKSSKVK